MYRAWVASGVTMSEALVGADTNRSLLPQLETAVLFPRLPAGAFDEMATNLSGVASQPCSSIGERLARLQNAPRMVLRAARRAHSGAVLKTLGRVGGALVADHPSEDLRHQLTNLRGRDGGVPDFVSIALAVADRRAAFWAIWFSLANLVAVIRFVSKYPRESRAVRLGEKSIAAYARARAEIARRAPSLVLCTHDIGAQPYFLAAAAHHSGIPVWLLLQDFAKGPTLLRFRPQGVVGYGPHDACGLMPQPRSIFVYPAVAPVGHRADAGLVIGLALAGKMPQHAYEVAGRAADFFKTLEDVAEVRVRPHPAEPLSRSVVPGESRASWVVDEEGAVTDFLCRCDVLILFGDSAVASAAARLRIPAYTVSAGECEQILRDAQLEEEPGRKRFSEVRRRLVRFEAVDRSHCTAQGHPLEMEQDEFFRRILA